MRFSLHQCGATKSGTGYAWLANLRPTMPTFIRLLPLTLLINLLGCEQEPKRLDSVPARLQPKVAQAEKAAGDLKKTLLSRLTRAMKSGGAGAGIEVCSTQARTLSQEVATRNGVQIGRSSERLRNPENAPRAWVRSYLNSVKGMPAAAAKPAVYDLGKSVGVVQPLGTLPLCVQCHGQSESLSAEVKKRLANSYPEDQATGFAVGDLRGVLWVEVAK